MHGSDSTDGSMPSTRYHRQAAIRELECLLASAQELRVSVRTSEAVYRKELKILKDRGSVSQALREAHAGTARMVLTDALGSFDLARHNSRLTLFAAGLAEDMTIGELGRAWRFSRQLASRYAKEARNQLTETASYSNESA